MIYQEYLPHPSLSALIECYWSVTGQSTAYRAVYPDGCSDIIFNFGSDLTTNVNGIYTPNKEKAFVVGNMLIPVLTASGGTTDLLGIRFHPGALSAFTPVPVHQLNDKRAKLRDVVSDVPNVDRLQGLPLLLRVHELDQFFIRHYKDIEREPWRRCLQEIIQSGGRVNLYQLQKDNGITERSLERKFRQHVGPGPKQLAQILRFRKIRASLDEGSSKSLLSLAFDNGFTDHAHLTKVFKTYAGVTPSAYRSGN